MRSLTPGDAVRLIEAWAGLAAGAEGILVGWYALEERMALVRFWDGGPLRVPERALRPVATAPSAPSPP